MAMSREELGRRTKEMLYDRKYHSHKIKKPKKQTVKGAYQKAEDLFNINPFKESIQRLLDNIYNYCKKQKHKGCDNCKYDQNGCIEMWKYIKEKLLEQLLKEIKIQNKSLKNIDSKLNKLLNKEDIKPLIPSHPSPDYISHPFTIPTPNFSCEDCDWNRQMKLRKEPYVGDTPCQWCSHNPYRVTCCDGVDSRDKDIFKPLTVKLHT